MSVILKTNNYDMFKKHENNRNLNITSLQKIIDSIKYKNLMEFRPILVDSKMRVIDGQHRLHACKTLGLDVYYQIQQSEEDNDIILLNANQKAWDRSDYLDYWCSKGKEDFLMFRRFCQEHHINETDTLRMIMQPNETSKRLKNGCLNITLEDLSVFVDNRKKVENIIEYIKMYMPSNNIFFKSRKTRISLYFFVKRSDVDLETFKNKLRYRVEYLKPCHDISSYIVLFTNIYNFQNKNPI